MIGIIKVPLELFFQEPCHFSFSRPCGFEGLYLEAHNPSRLSNSGYRRPVYWKWTGIIHDMFFSIYRCSRSHFNLAHEVVLRESNRGLGTSEHLRITILFQFQNRYFLLFFRLKWFGWLVNIHGMNLLVGFLRWTFIKLVHWSKYTDTVTLLGQLLGRVSWSWQS